GVHVRRSTRRDCPRRCGTQLGLRKGRPRCSRVARPGAPRCVRGPRAAAPARRWQWCRYCSCSPNLFLIRPYCAARFGGAVSLATTRYPADHDVSTEVFLGSKGPGSSRADPPLAPQRASRSFVTVMTRGNQRFPHVGCPASRAGKKVSVRGGSSEGQTPLTAGIVVCRGWVHVPEKNSCVSSVTCSGVGRVGWMERPPPNMR